MILLAYWIVNVQSSKKIKLDSSAHCALTRYGTNMITVLPPNSHFFGPGIFREFEFREFKIHDFFPIHCSIIRKNLEFRKVYLIIQ